MFSLSSKESKNGFTIAELLIVVAVIAVLVAVSIPIFRSNLEKAREAFDIDTMRQAASAAIDLYYSGVDDAESAKAAGLSWSDAGGNEGRNAYGAYDPRNGKIYPSRDKLPAEVKTYGKGTAFDGGTKFVLGNPNGAYKPDEDYTNAVVMIAIYPKAGKKHADIYWKNNKNNTFYVGGQAQTNIPKYCIRIPLE